MFSAIATTYPPDLSPKPARGKNLGPDLHQNLHDRKVSEGGLLEKLLFSTVFDLEGGRIAKLVKSISSSLLPALGPYRSGDRSCVWRQRA